MRSRETASPSPSPTSDSNKKMIIEDEDDPSGPRASDYAAMKSSLLQLHERNIASRLAATSKAESQQAEMKANQLAVAEACSMLERGLEDVKSNFEQRLDEYEALLSNRTEVARSLNLQLRKRSRYAHASSSSGGILNSEETMESILDALSNWFVTRSTRAMSEQAFLDEEELEILSMLESIASQGGAEGTIEAIFRSVQMTPSIRQRLIEKMKQTTAGELAREARQMEELTSELQDCHARIAKDEARIRELEEQVDKLSSSSSATSSTATVKPPRPSLFSSIMSFNSNSSSASALSSSNTTPTGSINLGHALTTAAGVGGANIVALARVSELENLLRKKMKQLTDADKKRTKLVAQLATLTKSNLEKDRALETASRDLIKTNLDLKEALTHPLQTNPHHDTLTKQILQRSSQQAEEFGLLKLFMTHTLWEREETVWESYTTEQNVQITRIRDMFDKYCAQTDATEGGDIIPSNMVKMLQLHYNYNPNHHPMSTSPSLGASNKSVSRLTPTSSSSHTLISPAVPIPLMPSSATAAHDGFDKDIHTLVHAIQKMSLQPEILAYVERSNRLAPLTPAVPSTSLLSHPLRRQIRADVTSTSLSSTSTSARLSSSSSLSHVPISFDQFLHFILAYHPYERSLERQRLLRRLRGVFDGLDHNRDGVLSILELESAYKKESIGITKEQLDSVYLCVTTPPVHVTTTTGTSTTAASKAGTKSSSSRKANKHHLHHQHGNGDDDEISIRDEHVHRPLDFATFLALFSVATLRQIFDRAAAASSSSLATAPTSSSPLVSSSHSSQVSSSPNEDPALAVNVAQRRHQHWITDWQTKQQAMVAQVNQTQSQSQNQTHASTLRSRQPLKPFALASPQAQAPKLELDHLTATASIVNIHPSEIAPEMAPYFTGGTKDILLHMLTFDSDAFPKDVLTLEDMMEYQPKPILPTPSIDTTTSPTSRRGTSKSIAHASTGAVTGASLPPVPSVSVLELGAISLMSPVIDLATLLELEQTRRKRRTLTSLLPSSVSSAQTSIRTHTSLDHEYSDLSARDRMQLIHRSSIGSLAEISMPTGSPPVVNRTGSLDRSHEHRTAHPSTLSSSHRNETLSSSAAAAEENHRRSHSDTRMESPHSKLAHPSSINTPSPHHHARAPSNSGATNAHSPLHPPSVGVTTSPSQRREDGGEHVSCRDKIGSLVLDGASPGPIHATGESHTTADPNSSSTSGGTHTIGDAHTSTSASSSSIPIQLAPSSPSASVSTPHPTSTRRGGFDRARARRSSLLLRTERFFSDAPISNQEEERRRDRDRNGSASARNSKAGSGVWPVLLLNNTNNAHTAGHPSGSHSTRLHPSSSSPSAAESRSPSTSRRTTAASTATGALVPSSRSPRYGSVTSPPRTRSSHERMHAEMEPSDENSTTTSNEKRLNPEAFSSPSPPSSSSSSINRSARRTRRLSEKGKDKDKDRSPAGDRPTIMAAKSSRSSLRRASTPKSNASKLDQASAIVSEFHPSSPATPHRQSRRSSMSHSPSTRASMTSASTRVVSPSATTTATARAGHDIGLQTESDTTSSFTLERAMVIPHTHYDVSDEKDGSVPSQSYGSNLIPPSSSRPTSAGVGLGLGLGLGLGVDIGLSVGLKDVEFTPSSARLFYSMYEAERQRVYQLERTLRSLSAQVGRTSSSGLSTPSNLHPPSYSHSIGIDPSSPSISLSRPVDVSLTGGLTVRHRPTSAIGRNFHLPSQHSVPGRI